MYTRVQEFIEAEGPLPKSRCVLQVASQMFPIVAGGAVLMDHPFWLIIWSTLSIGVTVLPIVRAFCKNSSEKQLVLQIAETIMYVAVLFAVSMLLCTVNVSVAIELLAVGLLLLFGRTTFREFWELKELDRCVLSNDRYYEEDLYRVLYKDYKRRCRLWLPLVALGFQAIGTVALIVCYGHAWDLRHTMLLTYIGWGSCALAEPSALVAVFKLRWLHKAK